MLYGLKVDKTGWIKDSEVSQMNFKGGQPEVEPAPHADCIFNFMVAVLMYRPRSVVILAKLYEAPRLSVLDTKWSERFLLFSSPAVGDWGVIMMKTAKERVEDIMLSFTGLITYPFDKLYLFS